MAYQIKKYTHARQYLVKLISMTSKVPVRRVYQHGQSIGHIIDRNEDVFPDYRVDTLEILEAEGWWRPISSRRLVEARKNKRRRVK